MGVDGRAVVGADVDIDADHLAAAGLGIEHAARLDGVAIVEHRQHRGAHHQRTAMGDAGLDDQIGAARPDQFLDRIEILRHLDDRPAEPGEILRIADGGSTPGQRWTAP